MKMKTYLMKENNVKKYIITGVLVAFLSLSSGCLMVKALFPGGTELTVKEIDGLGTIKDVAEGIAWTAKKVTSVAVPSVAGTGGLGYLIFAWLANRRKRKNGQ